MIFVIRQDLVVTLMCYCHFAITHVTQYRLICLIFMLTNTLIILAKADIRESQISIKLLNSVFWYFEGSHLRRVHPHLFSDMTTTIIVWRINRWSETLFFWIGLSYLLTYWLSLFKGGFITVRGTQFLVFKKLFSRNCCLLLAFLLRVEGDFFLTSDGDVRAEAFPLLSKENEKDPEVIWILKPIFWLTSAWVKAKHCDSRKWFPFPITLGVAILAVGSGRDYRRAHTALRVGL